MMAWDRILERFIIARLVDARLIGSDSPQFHNPRTMATLASETTWISRAGILLHLVGVRAAAPEGVPFDIDQYVHSLAIVPPLALNPSQSLHRAICAIYSIRHCNGVWHSAHDDLVAVWGHW